MKGDCKRDRYPNWTLVECLIKYPRLFLHHCSGKSDKVLINPPAKELKWMFLYTQKEDHKRL
eukprot:3687546-Prorocentrum_lima.AAC.1